MARRNRGPRVVWLPGTNANSVGAGVAGTEDNHVQVFFVGTALPTAIGDTAVGEIPLVIDSQDDVLDPVTSLSDIENSGYRLRRIVGKIWCQLTQPTIDASEIEFVVTAGLIVRRSNPVDGRSYAITTADPTLVNPQFIHNDGDPWIWRRAWILNVTLTAAGGTQGPINNFSGYAGGNADAAHVDQKTARIVSSEERLFLDVSVLAITPAAQTAPTIQVLADLRVLGSMRSSSGNRRNASR